MEIARVHVRPAPPVAGEDDGFPLTHPYVEHVYASVVGPTAVLMLRRFGHVFEALPDGVEVDPFEVAASLGIGHTGDGRGMFDRTVARLERFGLASLDNSGSNLWVLTEVPPLNARQLQRVPPSTRAMHSSFVTARPGAPAVERVTAIRSVTPTRSLSVGLSR